ncbi:hypothetical protein QFC21_002183 [Naganishia friedmannii]|uniref:Uncharacterized protein n=1 Tax=Naganishia friedmannii TaxID=89922 RepID=A0ACC2W0N0_9TREE|nr:hypothetical protein QFC21_002183 [Naganishia friedmannii]
MFTHDLVDTSIPGEVISRSPRSARLSSEGVKLDGMLYHSSVQLVKEIMNRSPSKRDRTLDRSRAEERQDKSGRKENGTMDRTDETDALERARRRIAAWPKRHRTAQNTTKNTDIETTQHSRTRSILGRTSYIIVDETMENPPSEYEDDDQHEQPRNTSRRAEKTPSPSLEQPTTLVSNELSSSSSLSAFRRRFEKIQSESPGRVSWTRERSGEGVSSMNGRNGDDSISDEEVGKSKGRLSGAVAQDDTSRSRMDTVPQETTHLRDRSESRNDISTRPDATVTDNEVTHSGVILSRRCDIEKFDTSASRQEITSSRRHSQTSNVPSRALPVLQETPRLQEMSRARSGIDMSFSHVEHSTPIRSTSARGLSAGGGVRALLGPSSEEDDTVDMSSSPPARSTPVKVIHEVTKDDVYGRGETSTGARTSRLGAGEAVAQHTGESVLLNKGVEMQGVTSTVPLPRTSTGAVQQELNTSRNSFKRSPLSRRMERSVSQEKDETSTPISHRMRRSLSQELEETTAPSPRRMERSVSREKEETRTPPSRRMGRSVSQEKEQTRTSLSPRMNGSVSQEKEQTRTRARMLSASGEASEDLAAAAAAKQWSTPTPGESSGREFIRRAGTPTSLSRREVADTPSPKPRAKSPTREDDRLYDEAAEEAFQSLEAIGSAQQIHEQVQPILNNTQHSFTTPTPPMITAATPSNAVTASSQAQRLARAVTQQVMTWYEQELLRTQEQEAASRAREKAEDMLRKRLRTHQDKTARESRRAWWRWRWTVVAGYLALLGLFSGYVCRSTFYNRRRAAYRAHACVQDRLKIYHSYGIIPVG